MSINGLLPVDPSNLTRDDIGNLNICLTVSEWLMTLALPDDVQEHLDAIIKSCITILPDEF